MTVIPFGSCERVKGIETVADVDVGAAGAWGAGFGSAAWVTEPASARSAAVATAVVLVFMGHVLTPVGFPM